MNLKLNKTTLTFLLFLLTAYGSTGQTSLKFESQSYTGGNGPSTTNKIITVNYGDSSVYSPP